MSSWTHDVVILPPGESDLAFASLVATAGALGVVGAAAWRAHGGPSDSERGKGVAVAVHAGERIEDMPLPCAFIVEDGETLGSCRVERPTAMRVVSVEQALEAEAAGAHAVILNEAPTTSSTVSIVCQRLRGRLKIPLLVASRLGVHAAAGARALGAFGVVLHADASAAFESQAALKNVTRRFRSEPDLHRKAAARNRVLGTRSAFASAYGIRYPIVQGPMTRVSDEVEFASAVATGGGLPTIALGMMRGPDARDILTRMNAVAEWPWGVGVLGFMDDARLQEQVEAIIAARPKLAIVAGANIELALALEAAKIHAFVHAPSRRLVESFARSGIKRFVLEGGECGGHVGPRDSLSLWDSVADALLELRNGVDEVEVLLAGGIHDGVSAAAAATVFGPVAAKGARVAVLMGTAYLFTSEAVDSGAITRSFQQVALTCERTALLETGPGHVTRVAATPWADEFERQKERLARDVDSTSERTERLEKLGLGRLLLAARGRWRTTHGVETVSEAVQRQSGSFMMGEVATLRECTTTIDELHREVAVEGERLLHGERAVDDLAVAVVGMDCVMPRATSPAEFWSNIVSNRLCTSEVPAHRWDTRTHYDPNGAAWTSPSKWGGFIPELDFDPLEFGIVPRSLPSIDAAQLLALRVAKNALDDSEISLSSSERERVAVVFGVDGGSELAHAYAARGSSPELRGVEAEPGSREPAWSEDIFPGILGNVVAGRVANRLDLGGPNYAVDAACASGLAAIHAACNELRSGRADLAIAGAVDTHNALKDYLMFASVRALSKTGRCRAFDENADGIVLGEGAGALVLKPYASALRDGDRVYAVIRSVGTSSDGRGKSLTAPLAAGQMRCLGDAYKEPAWSREIGLVEAHGTGTPVGDATEYGVLSRFFQGRAAGAITLGSVKTQIGHTKCAAGMAGFIKAALSASYGVLPPQHGTELPVTREADGTSPLVIRGESAPWVTPSRFAGVSAFGFGGTNFHAVLCNPESSDRITLHWPCELFLLRGKSRTDAWEHAAACARLANGFLGSLLDYAYAVSQTAGTDPVQYAFVASSIEDARALLLKTQGLSITATDISVRAEARPGSMAVLFPGQGSQRPGMWRGLLCHWPAWREPAGQVTDVCSAMFPGLIPAESDAESRLTDTTLAQQALGITSLAVSTLLEALGVSGDMCAGHSYGELAAVSHAGLVRREDLLRFTRARADSMRLPDGSVTVGAMVATAVGLEQAEELLRCRRDVWIATVGGPREVVLAGASTAITELESSLRAKAISHKRLNVARAFHTPLMAEAATRFSAWLEGESFNTPRAAVWSCDGTPYDPSPEAVRANLARQITSRIEFGKQILAMYERGARVFVDAGPGSVLSGLVRQNLEGRPFHVVTLDTRDGELRGMLEGIARLASLGFEVTEKPFFEMRGARVRTPNPSTHRDIWKLDGGGCRSEQQWNEPPARVDRSEDATPTNIAASPEPPVDEEDAMKRESAADLVRMYLENVRAFGKQQHEIMLRYFGAATGIDESPLLGPIETLASPAAVSPPAGRGASGNGRTNGAAHRTPRFLEVKTEGRSEFPAQAAPASQAAQVPDEKDLLAGIRKIVANETGYPEEMLQADTDLEAELGIDSIKRLEITVAACDWAGIEVVDGSKGAAQVARGFKTLAAMVDWVKKKRAQRTEAPVRP